MPNLKMGADDADVAESLVVGMRTLTGNSLKGVAGFEPLPDMNVVRTPAGKLVGSSSFAVSEGQDKTIVKRYFALSAGRLYALAFVCLERDLETQQKVFDEMVASWTW